MSDKNLVIKVGETETVHEMGNYIAVKETNVPLDIHIVGVGSMLMNKGEVWRIDGGFKGFEVENYGAVDGIVLLAVGLGDYRASLSVGNLDSINTIVNPVTVNPHNINTIVNPVTVNHVPPHEYPSHYQLYSGVAVNNAIVLPAANINGVIASNINIMAGGVATAAIMMHTSAPASAFDNTATRVLARASASISPGSKGEVFIPSGLGVYLVSDGGVFSSFDYEVL